MHAAYLLTIIPHRTGTENMANFSVGVGLEVESITIASDAVLQLPQYFDKISGDYISISVPNPALQDLTPLDRLFTFKVYGALFALGLSQMFMLPRQLSPFLLQYLIHGTLDSLTEPFCNAHNPLIVDTVLEWRGLGPEGSILSNDVVREYWCNYEHVQVRVSVQQQPCETS